MAKRTCSIDGCDQPHKARGWCFKHYRRWRACGDPVGEPRIGRPRGPMPLDPKRFWAKVEKTAECWVWKGARGHWLYGLIRWNGRTELAHRVSYELLVGPIPDGLVIDHLCRNTLCVRPDHLEPVTNAENVLRGFSPPAIAARRAECAQGHPYTPENTGRRRGGTRRGNDILGSP